MLGPGDVLTREQAACVLMCWAKARDEDVSARADLSAYPDAGSVSAWAEGGMSWAVASDVLHGLVSEDGTRLLSPQGECTRAQMDELLMNWLERE